MKHIYDTYGMLMVGTYRLSKKKSRTGADFPFAQLSNGAMKFIERGWSRVAFQKIKCSGSNSFVVQATIWRDKKLVGFLHNHKVDLEASDTVMRFSPSKKKKEIKSHPVVNNYSRNMNGVDRKDRDTADWTVSLKSNRFYMRIFYWTFDGVIHAMHCIVKDVVGTPPDKKHPWYRYVDKNHGRYRFQMDLAVALMRHGVSLDWKDPTKDERPPYVRDKCWDWIPCDCHKAKSPQLHCFFCTHVLTHDITHKSPSQKKNTPSKKRLKCSDRVDLGKTAAYCYYCVQEVKDENPGITVAEARKLTAAKAKTTNHKPSTRFGCKTCNRHVCERHWDGHGKND